MTTIIIIKLIPIQIACFLNSSNPESYDAENKALYAYVKEHDFYKIKSGIVEGKVSSADEIITLAKLPSREELIAKLAGALLGNITKLAVAVDQVRQQKENA